MKILQEMDRRLRELERRSLSSPDDAELQKNLGQHRKRAGPPDQEHNWRFNGKGWFTRPQWNGGRCPPDSQPTQHNTCIGDNDKDKRHYTTKPPEEMETERQYRLGQSNGLTQNWARRAELTRTPEVENSPIHTKPGARVNWDHPHGPKIYQPYDNEKPRPLPISPEHLPGGLTMGIPGGDNWREQEHRSEMERLAKHYTDLGYDPKYVRLALSPRETNAGIGSLSGKDIDRLSDRNSVLRAARKKSEVDRRSRAAEREANRRQHRERRARGWDDGYEDFDDDYENYGDYDYDDYDYDDHHDDDDREASIGGYKHHPGYPGHPDYPEFDGRPAEVDREPFTRERYPDRWHRNHDRHAYRPDPIHSPSKFTGPAGRGEPPWPRTGQRTGQDWED